MKIADKIHLVKGLDPVADAYAATVYSDVVDCQGEGILFIRYDGVGATGTSTITIEACDDTTPTTTAAVPFIYRTCTTGDTWGSWTAATTTGFATTAGSSQLYQMYVDGQDLAAQGYGYARLKMVEVVDSAIVGAVLVVVCNLRYGEQPSSLID